MKRSYPPLWAAGLLLILTIFWRMMGAPLTAEEFGDLKTPLWQMRALTPSRMGRILLCWFSAPETEEQDLLAPEDPEERRLAALSGKEERWLNVWTEDGVRRISLESYVCGVVAAEMPAAYHEEALKAQAVAARTRAVEQEKTGCPSHPEADICGDSSCCQGYAGESECRLRWGDEFPFYRERVTKAVQETADELLYYQGEPITALYHAMSGGRTEDVQAVFSQSLPYLVSVESAGEEDARGFWTDAAFSFGEMATLLNRSCSELHTSAEEIRQSFAVSAYTESGRVAEVRVGEKTLPASRLRRALSLRSTWFSITTDENGVTFHQRGYGHGVGMSQVGANSMAADGADYRAVLAHYYPGTELRKAGE